MLPDRRPSIRATLLAVALMVGATDALAQVGRYDPEAIRAHKVKTGDIKAPVSKFPGATRVSPEPDVTKSGSKALTEIVALSQAKQYPQAMQKAEALASSSSNAYERGAAYQLAANAAADGGDNAKAAEYFKKALDSNGLDNDDHYQVMYNLAVTQYQTQHPADAVATLDRLVSETKSDAPDYLILKAASLAELHRPQEAAALYAQVYGRDPANKKALMNAVAAYQQLAEQVERQHQRSAVRPAPAWRSISGSTPASWAA